MTHAWYLRKMFCYLNTIMLSTHLQSQHLSSSNATLEGPIVKNIAQVCGIVWLLWFPLPSQNSLPQCMLKNLDQDTKHHYLTLHYYVVISDKVQINYNMYFSGFTRRTNTDSCHASYRTNSSTVFGLTTIRESLFSNR